VPVRVCNKGQGTCQQERCCCSFSADSPCLERFPSDVCELQSFHVCDAGRLTSSFDDTQVYVCADEGVPTQVPVTRVGGGSTQSFRYVISTGDGVILRVANAGEMPPFNVDDVCIAACLITSVSYSGRFTAQVGQNIFSDRLASGEFTRSNSIAVYRSDPDFEDEHTIFAACDSCGSTTGGNVPANPFNECDDDDQVRVTDQCCCSMAGATTCTDNVDSARCVEMGGSCSAGFINPGSDISVCIGDGFADETDFTLVNAGSSRNQAYIITDMNGLVVSLPGMPPFDFESLAPSSSYLVYSISYSGFLTTSVGDNVRRSPLATGSYTLSTPVRVSADDSNFVDEHTIFAETPDDGCTSFDFTRKEPFIFATSRFLGIF